MFVVVGVLEQKDYSAAEATVWRVVQEEKYSDEISILRKNSALPNHQGKSLQRSRSIAKLSPFLDDNQNPVIVPRTLVVS